MYGFSLFPQINSTLTSFPSIGCLQHTYPSSFGSVWRKIKFFPFFLGDLASLDQVFDDFLLEESLGVEINEKS